jgi:hypothetical protein
MRSESGARARNDTLRSRAALGSRPAGIRTGLRGARWTGIGETASQEARLKLERGRWFAPRRAAVERRQAARPAGRAPHPLMRRLDYTPAGVLPPLLPEASLKELFGA